MPTNVKTKTNLPRTFPFPHREFPRPSAAGDVRNFGTNPRNNQSRRPFRRKMLQQWPGRSSLERGRQQTKDLQAYEQELQRRAPRRGAYFDLYWSASEPIICIPWKDPYPTQRPPVIEIRLKDKQTSSKGKEKASPGTPTTLEAPQQVIAVDAAVLGPKDLASSLENLVVDDEEVPPGASTRHAPPLPPPAQPSTDAETLAQQIHDTLVLLRGPLLARDPQAENASKALAAEVCKGYIARLPAVRFVIRKVSGRLTRAHWEAVRDATKKKIGAALNPKRLAKTLQKMAERESTRDEIA